MESIKDIISIFQKYNLSNFSWIIDVIIFCILLSLLLQYILVPIYSYIIVPLINIVTKVSKTCDNVIIIGNEITDIKKELKTNGGNSIKDLVIKLKNDISSLLGIEEKINSKQNAILNLLGLQDFSNGMGFYETDSDGQCKFVTHKWCEITGRTESESEGKGWLLAVHPDDRDEVGRQFYTCIAQQRSFSMEYRIYNPVLKKNIKVHGCSCPLSDGQNIFGYLGAIKPIEIQLYEDKDK